MSREVHDRPKYRQIADDLKAAIDAGDYNPGDRLPGENALMERYGVARMTARQALVVLQNEGITVTRRGAGVFVRDFRPIIRQGIQRLARDTWGTGESIWAADTEDRTLTIDQLRVYEADTPRHVARGLGLPSPAHVWVRSRRYLLENKPVLLAVSHLPAELVAGSPITEPNPGPGGIYARLKDLGHEPAHFREDLRARMPLEDEQELLELTPGTPVVTLCRTAYTAEGRAVELNEMTADASAYVLRYEFDAVFPASLPD